MNQRTSFAVTGIVLLSLLTLGGMAWANYRIVSLYPKDDHFVTYWVGTRAFLLEGISPYSDVVTQRIQTQVYGRLSVSSEHTFAATYPLYSCLLFLPFAGIGDYVLARALWLTALEVVLVLFVLSCLRLANWKPAVWMLPIYFLFAFFGYHSIIPLINGNAVLWTALFLALAFSAIRAGRDEAAGALLAFTTIQAVPLLVILACILLWAVVQRRWVLVAWFFGTMVFLSVVGMFFIPDWPLQYLRAALHYPEYPPPTTFGAALTGWWPGIGLQLSWAVTIILAVILLLEWWLARGQGFPWFLWAVCVTLVAGQWIGIPTSPANFILLFLPLTLIFAVWEERGGLKGGSVVIVLMVLLGVGLWVLSIRSAPTARWPQQPPALFVPLPLVLLVGLYWVRWWAIRPRRLFVEELRAREES